MNLSLNWLKRYIDFDLPVDELSEILTDIGLEVEGVEKVETIKGGLEGLVVGEVVECDKHPNADKLSLTKVNIGELELKQIVCGAPNVAAGQKVIIATIGTTLYTPQGESFKIKKGKIRGEASEGMICAEDEVGLGSSHDGIMVLPADVPVGTLAKDYYKIEDDYVFDIGLTPNRSDATCHLGVAKDLAAYLTINKDWDGDVKVPEVAAFEVEQNNPAFVVKIENEQACPRYTGISLSNIKTGESPKWMQDLLKAIGVRPISNVVDITNFILHELGQPLHAFDAAKVSNREIHVKNLPAGTAFLSLDEQERSLLAEDLMICDGQDKPMCIAGVFGGLNSGVTDSTSEIFLEAAHFSAGSVRRTSTKHLLRTDAAKVFEKGSDPNLTAYAIRRAALLLKEHAGATISSEIVDEYPEEITPLEIAVSYARVNQVIGYQLEKEEIHDILRAMEMELKPVDENTLIVKVPTNKADVLREIDVIEEILRIYGFNKVPIPTQLKTAISYQNYPTKRQIQNAISNMLSDNGFNEMMGLSLIESEKYYGDAQGQVFINNTSNIHLNIMRPDSLITGLKSVAHNLNHQQSKVKLYEFGRFYKEEGEGFKETDFLSLFITGENGVASWNNTTSSSDFYSIKLWVNQILAKAGIKGYQSKEVEDPNFLVGLEYHRGPTTIVKFGTLDRSVLKKLDIAVPVYYAEFNYKAVARAAGKATLQVTEISKYPSTSRDLALVLDQQVKFEDILRISNKTEKKLIKEISLFDVYKNEEQLGKGKKSYAVKFLFQDATKTLKDKEVDKVMSALISNFETKLGAEIRT